MAPVLRIRYKTLINGSVHMISVCLLNTFTPELLPFRGVCVCVWGRETDPQQQDRKIDWEREDGKKQKEVYRMTNTDKGE